MVYKTSLLCDALRNARLFQSMGFQVWIERHMGTFYVFYAMPAQHDDQEMNYLLEV